MLVKEIVIDENNLGYLPSLGISFELNETAKEIINYLKSDYSKEEIIEELSKREKQKWEKIYIDVEQFFQKLKIYGLL